ncbi:unnamed protein product, partial [Darwinula stevensoni]
LVQLNTIGWETAILEQREAEINANKSFAYEAQVMKQQRVELRNEHVKSRHRFEASIVMETRTMEDLKHSYGKAVGGKLTAENLWKASRRQYAEMRSQVLDLVRDAHRKLSILDEIALKPNPLSIIDYVDLLITSETFQMKPGYMKRVGILNEIRESLDKEGIGDERICHQGAREKGTNSARFSMCKRLGMSQNHQTEDEIPNRNPNASYINRAQDTEVNRSGTHQEEKISTVGKHLLRFSPHSPLGGSFRPLMCTSDDNLKQEREEHPKSPKAELLVRDLPYSGTSHNKQDFAKCTSNSRKQASLDRRIEVLLTGTSAKSIGDFLIGLFNVILDVTSGDLHRWTLEKVLQPDNDILILENNLDHENMPTVYKFTMYIGTPSNPLIPTLQLHLYPHDEINFNLLNL